MEGECLREAAKSSLIERAWWATGSTLLGLYSLLRGLLLLKKQLLKARRTTRESLALCFEFREWCIGFQSQAIRCTTVRDREVEHQCHGTEK